MLPILVCAQILITGNNLYRFDAAEKIGTNYKHSDIKGALDGIIPWQ